jgi:hypothetical protein
VGVLILFALGLSFKQIRRTVVKDFPFTEVLLPVDEQTAIKKIGALSYGVAGVNRGVKLKGQFAKFWLFDSHTSEHTSDDYQLRAHSAGNPALQRYVELSPDLRENDFFLLLPATDFYWPSSEYVYRGKPALFACGFIIHVQDVAGSATKLEVIETSPLVKIGKRIGVSAHTGPLPQLFDDIRSVAPTTEDRLELLQELERVMQDP